MTIINIEETISEKIYATYKENLPRLHLGASEIGHVCDRAIWLSFRWAANKNFDGRILKLFKRGQDEELKIISDLKNIGCVIESEQTKLVFSPHFKGSIDAIIKSGVPNAEKTKHVLECKTSNAKYFGELEKKGVEVAKPEHFVQMQLYMYGMKIERALYAAICKNDDRYYFERVRYNKEIAEKYIERANRIIFNMRLPEPMIPASSNWYQCKFCNGYNFCFVTKQIESENVNCRTCAHSTPTQDDTWICEKFENYVLSESEQRKGCRDHYIHPDLGNMIDGKDSRYSLSDVETRKICDEFNGKIE